ncbi:hypothetical protein Apa02nite_090630 [Actinoplanes palleronii]|uniref:Uncharacterized protein n=1 Tax=Actinoplanes palleronii TaxID=113570 RepID=A0ABQ4BRV2_9ACTN|nr:hypothetical protein Apa02nite_090630 [Actinoplanes palleronii]
MLLRCRHSPTLEAGPRNLRQLPDNPIFSGTHAERPTAGYEPGPGLVSRGTAAAPDRGARSGPGWCSGVLHTL